ncbi:hypothetical protein LWI29_001819 [Acer saccharum]|uniref:Uncharacterized protein n=1 Tax=Acer saccharum TaxID=4024 RepID=A0AA39SJ74_ACESA|nr:hypothetical protein LWI29_001819 [Acer saccharum]
MHSSLSFLVSGQAQQIFFYGFDSGTDVMIADPWFGCDSAVATVQEEPFKGCAPIVTSVSSIQDDMLEKQKGINNCHLHDLFLDLSIARMKIVKTYMNHHAQLDEVEDVNIYSREARHLTAWIMYHHHPDFATRRSVHNRDIAPGWGFPCRILRHTQL